MSVNSVAQMAEKPVHRPVESDIISTAETWEQQINEAAGIQTDEVQMVDAEDAEGTHTTELSMGQMTDLNMEGNTLTDVQKSRLNTLNNTINDHLTENDFSGTLRDLQGNPVPNGRGGYYDHLAEMKDSYRLLQKIRRALEGSLRNPNLSDIDRSLLQDGLDNAIFYINRIEKLFDPYGGIN